MVGGHAWRLPGVRGVAVRTYLQHGRRNSPDGSDPAYAGVEHKVGDPGVYEQFVNGSNAAATADSPNPAPLTVRLVNGPPNIMAADGVTIVEYTEHVLEIFGDVTGVNIGDIVFVLRPEFRFPIDKPCKGHDDAGNYVACRLLASGEFMWGVP